MWGITFACVVALGIAGVNAAVVTNEIVPIDNVERNVGFTSILIKSLEPKVTIDEEDHQDKEIADFENVSERNAVANAIRDLMEGFRDTVIHGNENTPPLDPLVIDRLGPYVYTYTGVRMTGNIRNFRMDGLKWYVVNDVTFSTLRMAVGIRVTVPWLTYTGSYDVSAWIAFMSHVSAGNYRLFVNRLDVDVDARIGTNIFGGHLVLRSLDIRIDVHDVQINVTGMTGSSVLNSLINNIVQGITRDFINEEMENVSRMISEAFIDVINDILKDFTLDDLL